LTSPEDTGADHQEPGHDPDDRAAKFAEGAAPIPRMAIVVAVVAFVVLGLGGVVFDHYLGGPVNTSVTPTTGTDPPSLETTAPSASSGHSELPASLSALLGLATLTSSPAPEFTLDAAGAGPVSLGSLRGKVVVLSFFDSRCNDICPVVASELDEALGDLGSDSSQVVVLTVNTDPIATAPSSAGPARSADDIGSAPEWNFLTGALAQLNAVWKAYGVSIEVEPSTGLISHNNVLYFIDQSGRLRLRATPFGNEATDGKYSLPASTESRFASGIAYEVRSLLDKT
jgi:cytochrome oxidase Cu insertion factor (SCO1/SenC/PrrC family)